VEEVGSVTNERFKQSVTISSGIQFPGDPVYGNSIAFVQKFTAGYDQFLNYINHTISWDAPSEGESIKVRVKATNTDPLISTPTITHFSDEVEVSSDYTFEAFRFHSSPLDITSIDLDINNGETWYISVEFFRTFQGAGHFGWVLAPSRIIGFDPRPLVFETYTVKPTSQVETSPIDFGEITASNPIFSVDDITESGALIAYSYEYSDAGSVYTPGGSIVDGDSLIASRFYKITADFTTTTGGRGKIREIQLEEGLFLYFGSHIDEPFSGVSPQLVPNSVSGFSQKITIGKGLSTTGQSTVKMFWVPETSDLIASGYLKGQDVSVYSGFKGLSTEAYEPVIVGTWFDHSLDEVAGEITVKVQDAFKQFEKRKIPEEASDPGTGEIDTSSTANDITFSAVSLVTAMKQIFDEIGLRDRYISPDFDTLEAGEYDAAKYKISRVLHKPAEANKLLDELAQTGSMFLIPLGNGQIKPKPFDINQEHTAELDANHIDFVNLEGNLDKFFTRFNSYYNPKTDLTADPRDDRDDFDNGVALLDSNAELRWFPEKGIKDHYDKWKVGRTAPATPLTSPPQALIDKNVLDNALLTEPLYTMTAKKMGPRFADIEPADVVQVNNLELPVVNNAWVDSASYTGLSLDTGSGSNTQFAAVLSDDGTKAYTIFDQASQLIRQWTLSTAYDISSATDDAVTLDVSTETGNPRGLHIVNDGKTLYLSGQGSPDEIYQYTLTIPWDLSTASYDSKSLDVSSEDGLPTDLFVSTDGYKIFVLGDSTNFAYQYSMTTAFDLSTASYDSESVSFAGVEGSPGGLFFSSDGRSMYMTGGGSDAVNRYALGVAWSLSIASFSGDSLDITQGTTNPVGLFFSPDGKYIYYPNGSNGFIYQYSTTSPWSIEAIEYTEGDRVIHDGKMWRARQDSTGKDPTSEAAFWQDTEILENGLTDGKHFFVLGRKFNPNTALIELDLMEMPPGTLGSFSADEFSSDFDIG
jgi:hypothetical protein